MVFGFATVSYSQRIKEYTPPDSAIYRGIDLYEDKQYQKAIESFKKISSNDPNYSLALYEIGLSFYDLKKYDSSLVYATESSKNMQSGIYDNAVILRGMALTELERFPEAIKNYDDALAKFPKNVNFLYNKGVAYKKSKEFQKALDLFKEVNIEYSGFIRNQLAIAQLAEEEGFLTQALLAYSHALIYSIGTNQHISILSDMNKLAAKKLEENPKEIVFSAEGDQFAEIENLLKTQAALQKKYKINSPIDLPIVRQLHLLFAQLENYEPGNGYFDKYYVPFYKELAKEGKFERYIEIIFMTVNDPTIQKIVNRRGKELVEFAEELGIKLATTVNKRDIKVLDKTMNLSCHFMRGIKSCGNYNENNKKEGVWYTFHTNGNLQRYGELTDGKANNMWEYFTNAGEKSAEYMFKDDKKNGTYKKFYSNGKLREEGNYLEDSLDGEGRMYYMNGNLKSVGNYINHKYEGEWRTYYVNSNPRGIYNYREDAFDGEYTTFAIDGKSMLTKLNYKKGELDGKQESFFLNGNKKEEGEFSSGKKIGSHKDYFSNGVLKNEIVYEDGEIIDQKNYYVNGVLYTKYGYRKGDLEYMDIHDYDGKLSKTYKFKNDYLKQMISYDANGQEIDKESIGKNDEFVGKWFYTNNKSMQGNYKKGRRHGKWIFYNLNGTKDSEANYELGLKSGIQRDYNAQGILISEYQMANDDNNGYYRKYYPSGELKSEGWYIDDKKNGPWYEYYIDGTLMGDIYYVNGDIEGKYIDYDPDGKAMAIYNYKDDEFVSYSNLDREGNELHKIEISESKTEMKPCTKLNFASYRNEKLYGLTEGDAYSEPLSGVFDYKGHFLAGEIQGLYTYYFPNGSKYVSSNYLLDNKEGADTIFYHNGAIYSIDNNTLGSEYGMYTRFYYTGQIWQEKPFVNGNLDSITNIYGINGELLVKKIYKLGFFYAVIRQNESGEFADTLYAKNESLDYDAKYKNGQIGIKESIKLENFLTSEYFDDKGQIIYRYLGEENGNDLKREMYYSNGKIMSSSQYDKGQLTEKSFYREDGSMEIKEEYKFDQTHGKTIVKDDQGQTKVNLIYRKNIAYEMGE